MGGRGSGGGKSGGGGSASSNMYNKKTDMINYINEKGGGDISIDTSYSYKDIKHMYKAVSKGKRVKRLGYEWVIDYGK